MLLRPYQNDFVNNAVKALKKHKKTLGIANTGAGKTIVLSKIIGEIYKDHKNQEFKACVLAHRDELTYQNEDKFKKINPDISTSICNANSKDWRGQVTFAMVQTLARSNNLDNAPKIDMLVIDEAHHSTSKTYLSVIEKFKERNNDLILLGVTATPVRNDNGLLKDVFGNVCHIIKLKELIASGYLVPPRTFVIDLGIQKEIEEARDKDGEYNMDKVADLMNTEVSNQKIVEHWREKAENRKTVIFCSTIAHAKTVTEKFISCGINAALITGEMNKDERRVVFEAMDKGRIQVVINVAVLTEGWDYQPISCVVLLRPCSFKGTMIQMIGRGLRTVDPAIYPDIQKDDCVVLDFGTSLLTHQSLEQDINLAKRKLKKGEAPYKTCPDCYHENHAAAKECEFCSYLFESIEEEKENLVDDFKLAEINLLGNSIFEWADINKNIKIATTFYSTALVIKYYQKMTNEELGLSWSGNKYLALGFLQDEEKKKINDKEIQILANTTNYNQALAAASDFMNNHNTDDSCSKSKKWLRYEPSENQLAWIPEKFLNKNINRYQATCILRIQFNLSAIKSVALTADVNFSL